MKEVDSNRFELARRRQRASGLLTKLFPGEVSDAYGGLEAAGEFVSQGRGVLILPNHFALRDGIEAFIKVASANVELRSADWLAPVAIHISRYAAILNNILGTQVDLRTVITPSAKRKSKYAHMSGREELFKYVKGMVSTLEMGGVVVLFPQATRKSYLEDPGSDDVAMRILVRSTQKRGVTDFGILPVGFSVPGTSDYATVNRLNVRVPYDIRIGPLWHIRDVIQNAQELNQDYDTWIVSQIRSLLPHDYPRFPNRGLIFEE